MGCQEGRPCDRRLDTDLLSPQHSPVDLLLGLRERARQRDRSGHIRGIQVLAFDTHIEQAELPRTYRTVVVRPVQDARVMPAGDDGAVTNVIAIVPGAPMKRALKPAFALGRGDLAHDIFKPFQRRVDGFLQLVDFPFVLNESGLRQVSSKFMIGLLSSAADCPINIGINTAHTAHRRLLCRQEIGQIAQLSTGNGKRRLRFRNTGTWPDPQFAVVAISIKRLGAVVVSGPNEQGGDVAFAARHKDEHAAFHL